MIEIKSENVWKVIQNFERVLPYAKTKNKFNMGSPSVSCLIYPGEYAHECGTVHCFAGWYFLAKEWNLEDKFLKTDKNYTDGALLMHNDMFNIAEYCDQFAIHSMREFFRDNKEIWGNKYGSFLFYNDFAFTPREKKEADNLMDCVEHLVEVAMRVQILELFEQGEKV